HLELGRKLHREIARLLAAQDAINIGGATTPDVYLIGSVGEQAAVSDKLSSPIDRRYLVPGRGQHERRTMHHIECIRHGDKAAPRLTPKGRDGRFDLFVAMNGRSDRHDLE